MRSYHKMPKTHSLYTRYILPSKIHFLCAVFVLQRFLEAHIIMSVFIRISTDFPEAYRDQFIRFIGLVDTFVIVVGCIISFIVISIYFPCTQA